MSILVWCFPLIMFFAVCDVALSGRPPRKLLIEARGPLEDRY